MKDEFPEETRSGVKKLEKFRGRIDALTRDLKEAKIDHYLFLAVRGGKESSVRKGSRVFGQAAVCVTAMTLPSIITHIMTMAKDRGYLAGLLVVYKMMKSEKFKYEQHTEDYEKAKGKGIFGKLFGKEDDDE